MRTYSGAREQVNVCFHGIGTPQRELETGEGQFWITKDEFELVLDEIATWPRVEISFDDGNASDLEIAAEPLLARGLTATFFVVAGRFGAPGSLDRAGARTLREAGMAIGTHGMNHRSWRRLEPAERHAELIDARAEIEDAIGASVDEAAAPRGAYDRKLVADLRELGYRRFHTSDRQVARSDSWIQPRFSVRSGDTPEQLRAELLHQPGTRRLLQQSKSLVKRLR